MKKAALNRIIAFTLAALPDSVKQRKELLADLLTLIPRRHPARSAVKDMLLFLEGHEKNQAMLALDFLKESK